VYYERLWATEYLPGSDVGGTTIRTTSSGGIPAALERELRFPYESGLDWASLVGAKEGNAATNAVLEGRRITTAEILHPDLTARGFEPSTVALPDISDGLGKDWKRTAGGSFGEFRLRNLLLLHLTGLPAVTGAEGWAGDRFETYGRKDGESLAVIRVAFASEQEAAEFVEAMDHWFASASARGAPEGSTTYAELPGGRAFAISQNGAQITLVASPEISAVRIAAGVLDAE
jgi:hypothetical protein